VLESPLRCSLAIGPVDLHSLIHLLLRRHSSSFPPPRLLFRQFIRRCRATPRFPLFAGVRKKDSVPSGFGAMNENG
jgi:hypothetical protein